jgi:hypothetical protein
MVLLQTRQVAVVPVPMTIAEELLQTHPTLGVQTKRLLMQLQVDAETAVDA